MRGVAGSLTKLIIFVVITVGATAVLGLTIANANFGSANDYSARFTDVTSLNTGDDVRIAGVKVGQVTSISVVDRRQAEVHFSVQGDVTLPGSVTATIKYRNLVGQRYVALGEGTGPVNATLPPGGAIPLSRTQSALDLTELFNGFKPLFQALSPDDVNQLSYEIIQVFQGEGGTIDSLLASTAQLTSTIANKDQVIGQVIDNLNTVLTTVNAHGSQLADLVTTTQQLVSGLAADRHADEEPQRQPGSGPALHPVPADQAGQDHPDRQLRLVVQLLPVLGQRHGRADAARCARDAAAGTGDPGEVPAMKPFRERNPYAIGIISLSVLVLVLLAAFYSDNLPIIGGGTTYSADFTEAAGLRTGDDVRVAGVKVGKVTAVSLDGDHVKVSFQVKNAWVGDKSAADIKIKTLLGAKYLSVDPEGTAALNPDTAIPTSRTTSPYDVLDAFNGLSRTVGALNTDQLSQSFEVLSETFANTPKDVHDALNGLSALSKTISSRDQQLAQLLSNTGQISQTLASRDTEVQKLLSDGTLLLGMLQQREQAIATLLSGTRSLSAQLSGLVNDNTKQLTPVLTQLNQFTTLLQNNQTSLAQGISLLAPFARLFANTVGNGRWFDNYICGLIPPSIGPINQTGCLQ